ncbi:hypothetical protein K1T71_009370 [Dendrolimus kikuchii]|uniref:Uncharacterized protein n=1 Tax=Dendrolimus kikuchii TaxID=765133 RepID=A0ACC1CU61_9NEOP|nr:hypothetical protein K1T71_009370 [Dendrolimus kikuchii]
MDELRGPNIQIVLHVKEGLGFGFLRTSFVVSGSLNGYMLETDPVIPSHAPIFDAELVWEADKRRFRSLRVQNVPVKIEVYTLGTQGHKDKVGYLLLSLLGAQPCPSNKFVDIKHTWHRLLGVKSEGKCCHPQLLMSLSIEDRINTPTPRNELRIFHSNEIAYPSTSNNGNPPMTKSLLMTLTQMLRHEGLIKIGDGKEMQNNVGPLKNENGSSSGVISVKYSIFTTGGTCSIGGRCSGMLFRYCPLAVAVWYGAVGARCRLAACLPHAKKGRICSMDLRKLIPTDDSEQFINKFCNTDKALIINERCFILRCEETHRQVDRSRKPFVDIEMSLKYCGMKPDNVQKSKILTARSATQLESGRRNNIEKEPTLDYKSGSCTNLDREVGGVAYTNMDVRNTARYKNASGEAILQTNEIAELIKKMCDSFTLSQEKLLAARIRPVTCDMQVQCDPVEEQNSVSKEDEGMNEDSTKKVESEPIRLGNVKSDTCIHQNDKDLVKLALSSVDRDAIMQKFVDELEDWKEKQQELYKAQLKRKEEYHLELLAKEWAKKRVELECKLSKGIEQCRNLAADLSRATEDFRLRGYRNTERERKLLEAKKALETHYTAKFQELREASQKMEDDMNHQLKLKDMAIDELELKVQQLEKKIDVLKNNIKNVEKEAESKYSGLTKDQTASLIQELRCLEEKLDSAVQSKAFFKEQWGRAVRELHLVKLNTRKQMLTQLHQDRKQLGEMGLETMEDQSENSINIPVDIKKLKDDFYVDILANAPVIDSHSIISTSGPDGFEMFDIKIAPKNPMNERINELILQRDKLIQDEEPDEVLLKQLNHEIRTLLLNFGT